MKTTDLPAALQKSRIFTAQNIEQLCTVAAIPAIDPCFNDNRLKNIFQYYSINPDEMETELQQYAKELLDAGRVNDAWQVLLSLN